MSGWFLKEGVWLPPQLVLTDPEVPFHIKRMLDVAARTAPDVVGGKVCCTAIGREVDPDKFSYHAVGRAVDLRTGLSGDSSATLGWTARDGSVLNSHGVGHTYSTARDWARRLRGALGDGYDVIYGFERQHVNHIHVERDKRDG